MIRRTTCFLVAGLLVLLGACSESDDTSNASSSGSASPAAEDTDRVVEITVSVQDSTVSPKPRRVEVEQDSQIRLLVTSDVDDEVHVHRFDIEEPLEAGRTTTVEFVVNVDGVFEVETHESELELLQLEVR